MKKVLFISSTGGHLNELMQLKPLFEKYNYHIITQQIKNIVSEKEIQEFTLYRTSLSVHP